MKAKTRTLLFTTCSIIFMSLVSCSTIDDFLLCLPKNCPTSNPIQPFVYMPESPKFRSTLQFYARNGRVVESRNPNPLAIVAAANDSHVQATVICAKSHDLQIRIRSGGHDYEGISYVSDVPYVILDMFNLRHVDVNIAEETAWVEAGATLGELYYSIANKSKVHAFPAGTCPTVGVGGHLSGGGYGNLMRKYGLASDNILDARLVNSNGTILNRHSMGEDLFWALRGGGGASFGVILSFKINLVPVPESVTVFNVHAFPAGTCPTVGVGGHLSGGGYGNLMRKYGLASDNILDARLVNSNGTILNRHSMGEDLFWALRGGGGASFGVILSFKINLVPVPESVTVFNVHAFPAGTCPTVGVGGHLSGGGYGNLMRKYGLASDNILDARLVNSNGTILNRHSMGEDLFWALRGGGGASFGVILSFKINLVPVPESVTVFNVTRRLSTIDIMHKFQSIAPTLPNDLYIIASARVSNGNLSVKFLGQFLGSQETLLKLMNKKFPELGLNKNDFKSMIWVESKLFFDEDGIPIGTPLEILLKRERNPVIYKNKSDFLKKPISKQSLQKIWKILIRAKNMVLQWNPMGGRMSEISESETPFVHRGGNLFLLQYGLTWHENGEEATEFYLNVSRSVYEEMRHYVSESPREAFLNFRDLDIGKCPSDRTSLEDAMEYGDKLFRGNFVRLVMAKTMADPTNFFKNEQSIPSLASLVKKKQTREN